MGLHFVAFRDAARRIAPRITPHWHPARIIRICATMQPQFQLAEPLNARRIVVAEMNMGQMLREVERCVGGRAPVVPCLRADGLPLTPEDVLARLEAPVRAGAAR